MSIKLILGTPLKDFKIIISIEVLTLNTRCKYSKIALHFSFPLCSSTLLNLWARFLQCSRCSGLQSRYNYRVAVKFAQAYNIARGDKFTRVHKIAQIYFSTNTLLHKGIKLNKDKIEQRHFYTKSNFCTSRQFSTSCIIIFLLIYFFFLKFSGFFLLSLLPLTLGSVAIF